MLYKIVPFLIWLHLQSCRAGREPLPSVKEILPEQAMRKQFWSFVVALALLLGAVLWPEALARPAGLAFFLCSGWLCFNLARAWIGGRRRLARDSFVPRERRAVTGTSKNGTQ
jgi:hypothetical protein